MKVTGRGERKWFMSSLFSVKLRGYWPTHHIFLRWKASASPPADNADIFKKLSSAANFKTNEGWRECGTERLILKCLHSSKQPSLMKSKGAFFNLNSSFNCKWTHLSVCLPVCLHVYEVCVYVWFLVCAAHAICSTLRNTFGWDTGKCEPPSLCL